MHLHQFTEYCRMNSYVVAAKSKLNLFRDMIEYTLSVPGVTHAHFRGYYGCLYHFFFTSMRRYLVHALLNNTA